MITLTKEIIESVMTNGCGIKRSQLIAVGETSKKGWKDRLIGKQITEQSFEKFKGKKIVKISRDQAIKSIPNDSLIEITNEIVIAAMTDMGGITNHQIKSIGLSPPLKKGWKNNIIGMKVTSEQLRSFLIPIYKKQSRNLPKQSTPVSFLSDDLDDIK